MSKRIDPTWLVFASIENDGHDRCVDLFSRPDGSFGFEEFRRDVEDQGAWTPVSFHSALTYPSRRSAHAAAQRSVAWLGEAVGHDATPGHPRSDEPDRECLDPAPARR